MNGETLRTGAELARRVRMSWRTQMTWSRTEPSKRDVRAHRGTGFAASDPPRLPDAAYEEIADVLVAEAEQDRFAGLVLSSGSALKGPKAQVEGEDPRELRQARVGRRWARSVARWGEAAVLVTHALCLPLSERLRSESLGRNGRFATGPVRDPS
jgi:hypothetical protein